MESAIEFIARRVSEERTELCRRWLDRLVDLLPVEERGVFPSNQLLDHVPLLLEEIAGYLRDPAENEVAASSIMELKARELGELRFRQQASVHQILREYEFLAEVLEDFVHAESVRVPGGVPVEVGFRVIARLHRAVRVLMQSTVDTFVASYDEKIARQRRELEDFNRLVGHEIRGPLSTLQIATSLLESGSAEQGQARAKAVGLVARAGAQMKRILADLDALSRTGAMPADSPSVQEVEIAAVARDVAEQLAELAAARGVEVRVAEDLPRLTIDGARLQMVLSNLVTNAIKYSDAAKAARWVEVAHGDGDATSIEIQVRDNGLGIDSQDLDRIFDRFFRAHRHLDLGAGAGGSGLGLAIVKEYLSALGGGIRVESRLGEGSTFAIVLPRGGR